MASKVAVMMLATVALGIATVGSDRSLGRGSRGPDALAHEAASIAIGTTHTTAGPPLVLAMNTLELCLSTFKGVAVLGQLVRVDVPPASGGHMTKPQVISLPSGTAAPVRVCVYVCVCVCDCTCF